MTDRNHRSLWFDRGNECSVNFDFTENGMVVSNVHCEGYSGLDEFSLSPQEMYDVFISLKLFYDEAGK